MNVASPRSGRLAAWAGIAFGGAMSGMLAPHDALFLPNVAFFWGCQLAMIGMLLLARPRGAAVAAFATVLAMLLLATDLWIRQRAGAHPDGLAWLLYPVLLFGAGTGAVGATWWHGSTVGMTAVRLAAVTALAAAGGSGLGAALACNTAFYCR